MIVETEYKTAQQVATLLNLHIQTVYDMCADGRLPSIKLGTVRNSAVRIPAAALEQYLNDLASRSAHP